VNRFRYPVVRIDPADMQVVADHLTLADAVRDAADRARREPGVRYVAEEPGCEPDYARTLT
jgi:hypothetical protein